MNKIASSFVSEKEKPNALLMEGIGIFCVMFVHSGTPNSIYALFSYGLASFIFARGYQWKERPFQQFVLSRVRLLITYYWTGMINTALFFIVVPKKFLSTSRVDYLLNFLVVRLDRLHEIPINIVPTWFLVMLFISEVAYYWLRKNKLLILLSFFVALLVRVTTLGPLPFKIDAAILSIPFFYIGEICKKRGTKFSFREFSLSLLALAMVSYANGDISWNAGIFGKNGLIAFAGELLTIPIVAYLSGLVKKVRIINLESFFYKLSFNALFVISYHFTIGSIIAIPFLLYFGTLSPVSVLNRVWFLHFPLVLMAVVAIIEKVPRKLLNFLTGMFWHSILFEQHRIRGERA